MRAWNVRRGRTALGSLALMLAVASAGCGGTESARRSEGSQVFRAGQTGAAQAIAPPVVVPGPPLVRLGLLTPAAEPAWQTTWVDQRLTDSSKTTQGARAGLMTGLMILQVAPLAVVAWPVAVGVGAAGVLAGSTAAGAATAAGMQPTWLSPPDEAAIASATNRLQANRLARAALTDALPQRLGRPIEAVAIPEPVGPEGLRAEWLAAAHGQGLDGLLEVRVEGVGLAAGDDAETFGAFTQIRLRVYDARDGRLRYERAVAYGPGQIVGNLPNPSAYSLIFLAADAGRVYRFEATQAIELVVRALTTDPALPVAGR